MFETQKSGDKTSSGEIGLNIRTHASPKVGQDHVSWGVSVLCWHAVPVANVLWTPKVRWKVKFGNKVEIRNRVKNWCNVLFANLLPNWTLLLISTLLRNFGISITSFHRTLQRVRLANRGRLILRTPGPVPFGTCICSNVETILSWTCHVYGPFKFRTSLCTSILLAQLGKK